jgi:DNA-binding SARP family transcriptional activator
MPEIHVTLLGRFAVTVGGVPVAEAGWKRRHAAAVVKVLALAPGRRLHREQVIDLVWPGDTIAEAVPKLHKAAHFARRAIGVPDSVVLRGDQVVLYPGGSVTVDAVQFEDLARRALAAADARRPARRSRCTAASCCPRTGTRSGPRPAASSSARATWTCCAWTAGGRRWPSSTRATSAPTSP